MENFITLEEMKRAEPIEGAFLSSVQTDNLTVAYTDMKANVEIPLHQHPEEAVDIIIEGELEMQIGEKIEMLRQGMITIVPSNIPHKAKAVSNCKVVTIFFPRRKM